jgi:hypothetical protein
MKYKILRTDKAEEFDKGGYEVYWSMLIVA